MAITTTPQTQEITHEVHRLMGYNRVSQLALSNQSGIPLSTLRRRLDGSSALNLDELVSIAEALGTSIANIVNPKLRFPEAVPA